MAGIDPIYVLVFITVIVGVVSLVFFLSPSVPRPQPTVAVAKASSKKKKPSSGSKSKSSGSKKKHTVTVEDSATELPASELSETEQPKAVVKFEDSLPEISPVNETPEESTAIYTEPAAEITEPKKVKKAKETPEQKEARLLRAKLAKEKSKETADLSESLFSSTASSSLAADIYYNPQISIPTTSSTPQHFDGWAVVDDKRKGKGKKGDSDASPDAEITTPTPAVPIPAPAASVAEPETTRMSIYCNFMHV